MYRFMKVYWRNEKDHGKLRLGFVGRELILGRIGKDNALQITNQPRAHFISSLRIK